MGIGYRKEDAVDYYRLKWMNYYDLKAMTRSGGTFRDKCEAAKEIKRRENNDGTATD